MCTECIEISKSKNSFSLINFTCRNVELETLNKTANSRFKRKPINISLVKIPLIIQMELIQTSGYMKILTITPIKTLSTILQSIPYKTLSTLRHLVNMTSYSSDKKAQYLFTHRQETIQNWARQPPEIVAKTTIAIATYIQMHCTEQWNQLHLNPNMKTLALTREMNTIPFMLPFPLLPTTSATMITQGKTEILELKMNMQL